MTMVNRVASYLPPVEPRALPPEGVIISGSRFRAKSRWYAVRFALEGLREAWRTQRNLRVHVAAGVWTLALGAWVRLSLIEWLWICFAIGIVIFAELMNTAIEQTVDLAVGIRPDPLARQVKDIAAGCVLAAALLAVLIGVFTFAPHLIPS